MPNVVLVVDMVRGFLEPGHNLYCGDEARRIIEPVRELLRAGGGRRVGHPVCVRPPPARRPGVRMFPVHCVIGTAEPEVIPELAEWVGDAHGNVIPKNRYSGFFNTDLAERLAAINPTRLSSAGSAPTSA